MAETKQNLNRKQAVNDVYEKYRPAHAEVPELEARELHDLLATSKNVAVVDVRDAAEYQVSMIPGSITMADFEKDLAKYKEHEIVCYCTLGYRSGLYAQRLRQEGLDARNLRGSILAWTHEGYPLVKAGDGSEETREVHVFNDEFELQAEGYTPVKFSKPGALASGVKFMAGQYLPKWLGGRK